QATGLTTVRFDAASEVAETTLVGSAGSIVRSAALSLEHRPRRHIILGASLEYEEEKFSGSGGVDEDLEFGLTGEYLFTPSAALIAAYSYQDSTSSTPGSDYSVNQFRLGVRVRR
ncbi:MAG: outer membrane beta-barrel protein, partial [Methyloligellaceae bacterium]